MRLLALPLVALLLALPAAAQEEEPVTPASVVEASSPDEWVEIAPEDLLVMRLQPEADGSERRVVIQLLPAPFSQPWVENIRTLAQAHWWDGTSVYRAVDNWVVQWGGGDPELGMDPRPLPETLIDTEGLEYISQAHAKSASDPASFEPKFYPLPIPDPYTGDESAFSDPGVWIGGVSGFSRGLPVAAHPSGPPPRNLEELEARTKEPIDFNIWPTHCYGSVGVARDIETTGTGSELYAVIGHAPRQLDRNIAVVGRVIDGMEHLSTLRRGTGDAGVYANRAEDTPIISVRLGSEVEQFPPPRYEYLATESESFARYVEIRANRSDEFYTVPAGGVDVCNVQVPIRSVEEE